VRRELICRERLKELKFRPFSLLISTKSIDSKRETGTGLKQVPWGCSETGASVVSIETTPFLFLFLFFAMVAGKRRRRRSRESWVRFVFTVLYFELKGIFEKKNNNIYIYIYLLSIIYKKYIIISHLSDPFDLSITQYYSIFIFKCRFFKFNTLYIFNVNPVTGTLFPIINSNLSYYWLVLIWFLSFKDLIYSYHFNIWFIWFPLIFKKIYIKK